ncbi:hypothetical protein FD04_GL002067 [Secundilactobacillus odoratitofui DSM 19909 = JCM 15043]|uniref:HTH marR-type domain-containing protein n=1 Tax=Secundilactobacillus odoratitofui DSM 19909 = JCM 15043 TaxID=1423776 RepID=A0A0R1LMX4_9LACO|nr:hypothetical protein [Secundilactobacillus odoratitofui]KRK97205.1 hypothetical protein FD04_GL002067 [Secundilactobacillus odoratitofui DSM 19909 = JCM 15043]
MDKLDFYKHQIENPLIDIINTRAQDNNFERQWLQLHIPNRDLQYALSQLSTLSLKLLQQIATLAPVSEAELVTAMSLDLGVISKNINKLSRLGFISKLNGESGLAYRPTKTGTKVVEVQGQLSDLLDKQHTELVDKYTPEQLTTVATFLQDLQAGH